LLEDLDEDLLNLERSIFFQGCCLGQSLSLGSPSHSKTIEDDQLLDYPAKGSTLSWWSEIFLIHFAWDDDRN
jgi:hypothetical protein